MFKKPKKRKSKTPEKLKKNLFRNVFWPQPLNKYDDKNVFMFLRTPLFQGVSCVLKKTDLKWPPSWPKCKTWKLWLKYKNIKYDIPFSERWCTVQWEELLKFQNIMIETCLGIFLGKMKKNYTQYFSYRIFHW